MDALVEQFFNLEIMVRAWPTIWRGLLMTLLLCAVVVGLGLIGGCSWRCCRAIAPAGSGCRPSCWSTSSAPCRPWCC